MSSLNNPVTANTFGKKLPSVIIDRIELSPRFYGTSTTVDEDSVIVDIYLSISFTKPEHMQTGTISEIIKSFDNLFLYSYLTHNDYYVSSTYHPFGRTPEFLKEDLENSQLSLGHWFNTEKDKFAEDTRTHNFKKISLSEIINSDPSVLYGGTLTTNSNFDANGNEIVTISNIQIRCDYYQNWPRRPRASQAKLLYFTFIGLDNEDVFGTDRDIVERGNTTQNMYFGDISYYYVLENNKVPSKFYQAYTDPSGVPYDGPVLQSINGNVYSAEQYSFNDIKESIVDMISNFEGSRSSDLTLDNNIKSLEAIINASENTIGVLGELATYRSTYPNKSQATLSGEFYNQFIIVFQQIISSVEAQVQLSSTLLYDSLVVDNRFSLVRGSYAEPAITTFGAVRTEDVVPGVPYTTPSDCFIPKKWFMLSRKSFLNPAYDYASRPTAQSVYGLSNSSIAAAAGVDGSDLNTTSYNDYFTESNFGGTREELVDAYISEGMSEEVAEEMADDFIDYTFTALESADMISLLYPSSEGSLVDVLVSSRNLMVKNQGTFIFDYEKALRTQSKISKIFDLAKLQLLTRYNIAYESFFMTSTELSRNELRIGHSGLSGDNKYIRTKLELKHDYPNNSLYRYGHMLPLGYSNDIRYTGASPSDEDEVVFYFERIKNLHPVVGQFSHENSSYLLPFNFDLPNPDPYQRLIKYNSMDNAAVNGFSSLSGQRVIDGYRLIAYKFQEYMDDDVAYYNTIYDSETRFADLRAGNNLDEPRTCYGINVQLADRTCSDYEKLVQKFTTIYNNFLPYYEQAAELCSYNNIKSTFNQWFMDQINDLQPDKPWIAAAHAAQILSELIFVSGSEVSETQFEANILETIFKIAPETGNLPQLEKFMIEYNGLMRYICGDAVEDLGSGPAAGVTTPYTKYLSLQPGTAVVYQFYNEKPIWEPVAGLLNPDLSSIDPDDLPEAAVIFTLIKLIGSGESGDVAPGADFVTQTAEDVAFKSPGQPPAKSSGELRYNRIYTVDVPDNIIKYAHEIIWWPVEEDTLRYNFFNGRSDRSLGDGFPESLNTTQWRTNMARYLNSGPKRFQTDATTTSFTMFQYWIERIMRRTTVDTKLNTAGTGARSRIASTSIDNRRNKRNLFNVLQALVLLNGQAARRFDTSYKLTTGLSTVRGDRDYDPMKMRDNLRGGFPLDDDAREVLNARINTMTYQMVTHCKQLINDITDNGTRTNADAQAYFDQKILNKIEAMDETRTVNWPYGNAFPDDLPASPAGQADFLRAFAKVPSGPSEGEPLFEFTFEGVGKKPGDMPDVQIRRSSDGSLTPKYPLGSAELKALPIYIALSDSRKKALHGPFDDSGRDLSIQGVVEQWNKTYPEGTRRGALQRIKYLDMDIAWTESLNQSNILGPLGSAAYMFSERDDGLSLDEDGGLT